MQNTQKDSDAGTSFVQTPTATEIAKFADLVRASRRLGFIFGAPQIGKTTALAAYASEHAANTTMLSAWPKSGLAGLARDLATARGVPRANASAETLQRAADTFRCGDLIIVDEAHQFIVSNTRKEGRVCLETLRHIADRARCGLLFCDIGILRTEMQTGSDASMLAQLERRSFLRLQLPDRPSPEDVAAIAAEVSGLESPTPEDSELLNNLAARGGITAVCEVLRLGARMAANKKTELRWHHVAAANNLIASAGAASRRNERRHTV